MEKLPIIKITKAGCFGIAGFEDGDELFATYEVESNSIKFEQGETYTFFVIPIKSDSVETDCSIRTLWDSQADEYNRFDSLGIDEIEDFANQLLTAYQKLISDLKANNSNPEIEDGK
jgi:hypothetical protein